MALVENFAETLGFRRSAVREVQVTGTKTEGRLRGSDRWRRGHVHGALRPTYEDGGALVWSGEEINGMSSIVVVRFLLKFFADMCPCGDVQQKTGRLRRCQNSTNFFFSARLGDFLDHKKP